MTPSRSLRVWPAAVLLLCLLWPMLASAVQPALREYETRRATFRAQIPAIAASAEHAANTMLDHPDALLNVPHWEQMGFSEELTNRAGGLAHVSPTGGWGRDATPHDVVLLSVRAWATQSDLVRRRVREYHAQGWTVTVIGSRAGRPRDLGADFFIDNGAPSGAAGYGRINALANVTLGWMWCCEYGAAMSRRGKFPAVLQSICVPGGEDYDRTIQSPSGRKSVVDCPRAIPAGELSQRYLARIDTMVATLASPAVQEQFTRAADVCVDQFAKGGTVGVAGLGHLIIEETKVDCRAPWRGFRAVFLEDLAFRMYLQPGDVLVWISYDGMNSIYADYGKRIHEAGLRLVTSYTPSPTAQMPKEMPPVLAHINQSWVMPDAEVPIPVFPNAMAPVSGVESTLHLRMLDDEIVARMRQRRVAYRPRPFELPYFFRNKMGEEYFLQASAYSGPQQQCRWTLIDDRGKALSTQRYADVREVDNGPVPVKRDGRWGFADATGRELVAPAYDEVREFFQGLSVVSRQGKYGMIDAVGAAVVPLRYDAIREMPWLEPPAQYVMARVGKQWGLLDRAGKALIAPQYDEMDGYTSTSVIVRRNGKYGIIAMDGTEVLPPKYDGMRSAGNGLRRVMINRKWGLLDAAGQELIPPVYDRIYSMAKYVLVNRDNKWGTLSLTGAELIPCVYDDPGFLRDDLLSVKRNGKWGVLNEDGRELVPPQYEEIARSSDGKMAVKRDGLWGYIDLTGTEVLPPAYQEAEPFDHGIAVVTQQGRERMIDATGKELALPPADFVTPGGEGLIKIARRNKWGFVDQAGREVVPPRYSFVMSFKDGLAAVAVGGKWVDGVGRYPQLLGCRWGIIDRTGKEIIPPKYDTLRPVAPGLFAAGAIEHYVMPQP